MIIHSLPKNPPAVILIDPQECGNIGSVARAMMNFGLIDLRLVRPRSDWLQLFTRQMASGANEILNTAKIFHATQEAIADLHVIYATASQTRDMIKSLYTPKAAALHMQEQAQSNLRIGILFGTEQSGLENEDMMRAYAHISIPTSPHFDSLNLAQAVLLVGYEWLQTHAPSTFSSKKLTGKRTAFATYEHMEGFFKHLEEELDQANFWRVPHKKPDMLQNIRNIFNRITVTQQEVRTLRGILKALVYHRWNIREKEYKKTKIK